MTKFLVVPVIGELKEDSLLCSNRNSVKTMHIYYNFACPKFRSQRNFAKKIFISCETALLSFSEVQLSGRVV